jgi:hypothetical protein
VIPICQRFLSILASLLAEAIEGPVRSKQPIGDHGMEMVMKPGIVSEGVDRQDHARYAVMEVQFRFKRHSKKHLKALFGRA